MATTASNKTEIDKLTTTAQTLEEAAKKQASDIQKLNDELQKLRIVRQNKTAKQPPVFNAEKYTFHTWSGFAKNYFVRTGTDSTAYVGLLLTYLSPDDYSAVSRVYDMEELMEKRYDEAVDCISHIISDKVDRSKAVSRLMRLRQGNSTIQEFIQKLSEMAKVGFPEPAMENAKQRCLTSALQANVRSKLLSYEIHRYLSDKPTISFEDLSLKVLELEQVLAGEDSGDEDTKRTEDSETLGIFNVTDYSAPATQVRRCFVCNSANHLQRDCPQGRRNRYRRCYECQSPYHLWRDCPYIEQEILPNQDYNSSHNRPDDNDDWRHDNVNMVNDQEQEDKDGFMNTDEGQDQELQLNYHFPEGLLTS